MLLFGWSLLEGIGAALIMPAIVALVATNFEQSERPRAYGMVAAFGAIAVAVGPLIGGVFTTYASWRWVFAGEVLIVLAILVLMRRMADAPPDEGAKLDLVGTALSAVGLGLVVFGILQAGTWGFVTPKPGAPDWFGLSPVLWLVLAGGLVLRALVAWEARRLERGASFLLNPAMLRNERLRGGLVSFFLQYFLQSGLFFVVPLFLSICPGSLGDPDRAAAAAALPGAAGGGRRHPEAPAERVTPQGRPVRLRVPVHRDGPAHRWAEHRGRPRGGHGADAVRRAGHRCPRLPARQRHRVRSA